MMKDDGAIQAAFFSLPHAWMEDHREPLFSLETQKGDVWDFYLMSFVAWNELVMVPTNIGVVLGYVVLCSFYRISRIFAIHSYELLYQMLLIEASFAALLSILVYREVVQKQGTWTALAITYGLIGPSLFLVPYWSFSYLQLRNQLFRFCLGGVIPIVCLFKTMAAVHGFTPKYAIKSVGDFALYYAPPMMMEWDSKLEKLSPATTMDTLRHLRSFFLQLTIAGCMMTLLEIYPHLAPPLSQGSQVYYETDWYSWARILQPQTWFVQNLCFVLILQSALTAMGEGLTIAQSLATGYKTHSMMDNPFFTARSYAEFWNTKWNMVIHDVLKRGVYLPVRQHCPRHVAMFATFVASGLFHEVFLWIYTTPFDDRDGCWSDPEAAYTKGACYHPRVGMTSLFFLWHAGLVGLQFSPLGQLPFWGTLPNWLATILVMFTQAPLGHFFFEPYWNSMFLKHFSFQISHFEKRA